MARAMKGRVICVTWCGLSPDSAAEKQAPQLRSLRSAPVRMPELWGSQYKRTPETAKLFSPLNPDRAKLKK